MSNVGYIRLSRKFFNNAYWLQQRTFSLSEAWLDLIQMARFDAEPSLKILPCGRQITIERGEIHSSLRFLSDRWGWSVEKTQRYINKHIEKQEIERKTVQGESVLKLCKYDSYNPLSNTDPYTDPYTDRTPTSTKNNKDNKVNKEKEGKESSENAKRFSPPSVEDVQNFIIEKGYNVDAEAFVAFYTSKNWFVGKNKMKCWRSAVVTWQTRNEGSKGKNTSIEDKSKNIHNLLKNKQ